MDPSRPSRSQLFDDQVDLRASGGSYHPRPFSPYHLRQRQLYLLHQREFQQSVRLAHQRETQIAGGADTGGNGDPWMVPEAPIQHPFMRLGAYRAAALALIAAGEIDDQSAAVLPRFGYATSDDDEMPRMDWDVPDSDSDDEMPRLAPAA